MKKKDIIMENEKLDKVHFTGKRNPVEGVVSILMGIVTIVVFLALTIVTTINKGEGGWVGLVGCLALAGNLYALFLAVKALRKEDAHYKLSNVAVAVNGIMAIGYMALYLWGAAS